MKMRIPDYGSDHIMVRSNFLQGTIEWAYGIYAWLVFLVLVLSCGSLAILIRQPSRGRRIACFACRTFFAISGIKVTGKGLENLPPAPHVLLLNHTSFLDAIALIAILPLTPGYAFTTRQEFHSQRILCPLLKSIGTIVLDESGSRHPPPNVERMAAILRLGRNLVVFPEGAFRPEPGLLPFHSGAFIAASRVQVPLATAGLRGTREALPLGKWLLKRIDILLEIGPVFTVPDEPSEAQIAALVETTRDVIASMSGEAASS